MSNKNTKERQYFKCFDGIRGAAALTVIFSHTINAGGVASSSYFLIAEAGVWCFFILSSFLLIYNLYNHLNHSSFSIVLRTYALRRFLRIYPIYLLIWLFVYFFPHLTPPCFDLSTHFVSFNSLFLISSKSIMWTIPVEMQAYFLLPILVLIFYYCKKQWIFSFLMFSMIIGLHNKYVITGKYGYFNSGLYDYIPVFIEGSLTAILYIKIKEFLKDDLVIQLNERFPYLFTLFSIIGDAFCWFFLFLVITLSVPNYINNFKLNVKPNDPVYQSPLLSLMLLFAILSQRTFVAFFEWSFFVYCGKISFSLYLVHLWGIWCVKDLFHLKGDPGIILIYILDILLASIVYYQIELRIQLFSSFIVKKINQQKNTLPVLREQTTQEKQKLHF